MNKEKNIVFFVTNLESGGLENYLLRFLQFSFDDFNEIIVYCKGGQGGVLEKLFLEIPNIRIVKSKVGNFHPIAYYKLYKWLKDYTEYVVCDFTGNFSGPILSIASYLNIQKRIVFYRSSSNRFKETWVKLKINKLYNYFVYKYATDILANSAFAFDFFFQDYELDKRMCIIYNGINSKEFLNQTSKIELGLNSEAIVIGHTGRYNPAKNHLVMVDVAESIIKENKNIYFLFCGKDVPCGLESLVEEKDIGSNIILFDNRDDISNVLNSIDIYYFPSITEGQPNALIEAWLKGKPFVASNIKPIKDITPSKFQDCLVDCNDTDSHKLKLKEVIMSYSQKYDDRIIADYAKKEFDAETRFNEFLDIIINKPII